MTVTFETKCWEKDWEIILKTDYLKQQIANCNYNFDRKVLYINNVKDIELVRKFAEKAVSDKIIDSYVVVNDYAQKALDYFNLKQSDFRGGYYYSIAELVGIFLCETDYLVHFSSDSRMPKFDETCWIDHGIELLNTSSDFAVVNPIWNYMSLESKHEAIGKYKNFYKSVGFSDQCYLIKTNLFKDDIYHYQSIVSNRYPAYGGELFEKRVDSFLRCRGYYRAVWPKSSYVSCNFDGYNKYIKDQKYKKAISLLWLCRYKAIDLWHCAKNYKKVLLNNK